MRWNRDRAYSTGSSIIKGMMRRVAVRIDDTTRWLTHLSVYVTLVVLLLLNHCTIERAPDGFDSRLSNDRAIDGESDASYETDNQDDDETIDATGGCADPDGSADTDQTTNDVADTGGSIHDRSITSDDSAEGDRNAVDNSPTDATALDSDLDAQRDKDAESDAAVKDSSKDSENTEGGAADAQRDTSIADSAEPECPFDMVAISDFCIDIYEASRSDATDTSAGSSSQVKSRPGVIPWQPVTLEQARAACATAGKRLCRPDEWFTTCRGPDQFVYTYGNAYEPVSCNGVDTFCNCSSASCETLSHCPYPHCYDQTSTRESGGPCGASFHIVPTGSFTACTNAYGIFDINGNVWEVVDTDDGLEHFRGGAYNCGDSELLHRCDYDATWNPSAKGFRCCKERD